MSHNSLKAVVTGACGNSGRALAKALGARGASLLLADNDGPALSLLSKELGAKAFFCDVAAVSSVQIFAAEILARWSPIDVLVNAAGSGYERTLGMHRVSRALMPAIRRGRGARWIINVPPSQTEKHSPIFSYASSEEAFARLSEAVAQEAHGSGVSVGIACPSVDKIQRAGTWRANDPRQCSAGADMARFGERVAALLLSAGGGAPAQSITD